MTRKPTNVHTSRPGTWPPSAVVCVGSEVIARRWGITRWHALGRAIRWAYVLGADASLVCNRWVTRATLDAERSDRS